MRPLRPVADPGHLLVLWHSRVGHRIQLDSGRPSARREGILERHRVIFDGRV